ncbi:MAG: riboflavin synthase [Treponema sp.]|jgi:riboflavin synthase|nr:riboflavin synthase [Treponema sp.]
MFTGIVEEVGTVSAITHVSGRARLVIQAEKVLEQTKYGDSINVEGACQTVAELSANTFTVFTLAESLKKTTLGLLRAGSKVNLERAMLPTTRMGGHMVQGHVSAAVPIRELSKTANNVYLAVEVPEELLRLCVPEGSVALDGISLTIAKISGSIITVNVIPVTIEDTSLKYKKPGDKMNLETDIIGRYVERYLAPFIAEAKNKETNGLSIERMLELGY